MFLTLRLQGRASAVSNDQRSRNGTRESIISLTQIVNRRRMRPGQRLADDYAAAHKGERLASLAI